MASSDQIRAESVPLAEESGKRETPWWEVCPICGSKLMNQKCRLVCPDRKCGYFQSCSEFDT